MAAITSAGLGSGLDIEGLVTKLVAAEGQPATLRLTRKEANLQADLSALGTLKSALSAFQTNAQSLSDVSAFQGRQAASSNTDLFTVSAVSTALAGSYSLEVVQLAQSEKLRSGDFGAQTDVVGTGKLTLSLGENSFEITVDGANNTLAGIRDAINTATDNPGIKASVIHVDSGYQLVLTTDKIGASNAITVTTVDDDLDNIDNLGLSKLATANLTTVQSAQDAVIKVDDQLVTRGSNSIADAINGVTITLKKAEAGTKETLSVGLDKAGVKTKLDSFVKAYNALTDTLANLSGYDAETKQGGVLLGDSTVRGVQSQIRRIISNTIPGLNFSSLSQIGVTTDDSNHLVVDSTKLDSVLESDFSSVSQLFSSDNGVAKKLGKVLSNYLSSGGIFDARTKGIQNQINTISEDRERLNRRLSTLEARYRAQFTAMDKLVGQLQSTSSYLAHQLSNLPGSSNNN
ncbi:MAG: flagellar filament capping protein FliD [Gammaproteobacteria bacterium]